MKVNRGKYSVRGSSWEHQLLINALSSRLKSSEVPFTDRTKQSIPMVLPDRNSTETSIRARVRIPAVRYESQPSQKKSFGIRVFSLETVDDSVTLPSTVVMMFSFKLLFVSLWFMFFIIKLILIDMQMISFYSFQHADLQVLCFRIMKFLE